MADCEAANAAAWGNVTNDFDPFQNKDGSEEFADRLERKLERIRFGTSAAARRRRRAPTEKTTFKSLYHQMSTANTAASSHNAQELPTAHQKGSMLVTPVDSSSPQLPAAAGQPVSPSDLPQLAPDGMSLIFAEATMPGSEAWQDALEWYSSEPTVAVQFQPLVPELPHAALHPENDALQPPQLPLDVACTPTDDDDLLMGGDIPPGHALPSSAAAGQDGTDPEHPSHTPVDASNSTAVAQAAALGSIPWKLEPPAPPDDMSDGSSIRSTSSLDDEASGEEETT